MSPEESTKDRVVRTIAEVLGLEESEVENLRAEVGYKRLKKWTSARHAEISGPKSGRRASSTGVGTAMITNSALAQASTLSAHSRKVDSSKPPSATSPE